MCLEAHRRRAGVRVRESIRRRVVMLVASSKSARSLDIERGRRKERVKSWVTSRSI